MEITAKDMPAMRVGAIRHSGPYNQIGPAFQRLGAIAGPAGLFQQPGALMLGIFYDDPATTPSDQLRSDAAIVVPEQVSLPEGLTEQRIPAGRFASVLHIGPYEGLPGTWGQFKRTLATSGYTLRAGHSFEIYWNNPMTVPPDQLRTELCVAIV